MGVRGRETSAFEMVLSPEAKKDKLMAALSWFLPRKSNCIINRKVKFKIFAILLFNSDFFEFSGYTQTK